MPVGAIIGAGASIASGFIGANASKKAAAAQAASAAADRAQQFAMYNQTRDDLSGFRGSGNRFQEMLDYDLGASTEAPEGYAGYMGSPGLQFQMQQGLQAIEASAASRGMLRSGGTMQAQQEYGQGLAQQDYGNHIARLMQGTSMGLQAAGQQVAANQNYAAGASNTYAAQGNAQAAGIIGGANAFSGAINNLSNLYGYQQAQGQNMLGGPAGTWGFN